MVKSKKAAPVKKGKTEDNVDVDPATDNSVDAKTEEELDKVSQENGEVDVSLKKKGKAKSAKKEEATSDDEDKENGEASEENGEEDSDKKKPASKKSKETKASKKAKPSKPASEPSRKSSRTPKPVAKEESDDQGYEVEKLVDFRLYRGKPQYLVRWKGYTKSDDTWEDESALNCPELLQTFKSDSPDSKKAKKRSASKSPAKTQKKTKAEKKEEDYEVEEIVGMRVKNGKKEFKIRWKGYKPSDDSWEPEKHLSCQDLIEQYLEEHKDEVEEEEKKTTVKKVKTPAKSAKGRKARTK